MSYYIFIQNNKLNGGGQCKCLNEDIYNAEVTEDLYNDYNEKPLKYIVGEKETEIIVIDYDEEGNPVGEHTETITVPYPVLNPNYEQDMAAKECEKINRLTCTKRVFVLILQEKGVGYSALKELISSNEQAQLEWDLCERLERSNPLLEVMAQKLNYTSKDIDDIFIKANM